MSALTKLGVVLTVVFAVSLVALAAQIAWVLWRRNRIFYNNSGVRGGDREGDVSGGAFRELVKAMKEPLYFFCWKDSQSSSRVEPNGRAAVTEGIVVLEDGDEVLKWHTMYRESRMLYTIKEEEKEGEAMVESDRHGNCSGGSVLSPEEEGKEEEKKGRRVCLKECLDVKEKDGSGRKMTVVIGKTAEESAMELTPFSTPCESPNRYFTPSPSPPRTEQDGVYADYAKMVTLC